MARIGILAICILLVSSTGAFAQVSQAGTPEKPLAPLLFSPQIASFPEGAKIGFINFQVVADQSMAGKAATQQLKSLQNLKFAEIEVKSQALRTLQGKQSASTDLMPSAARKLQHDIERAQLEIQYAQQLAQKEIQDLNDELMNDFSDKLKPVVEQLRAEKGLWVVLVVNDNLGVTMRGLDLSQEVVKRLDAAKFWL